MYIIIDVTIVIIHLSLCLLFVTSFVPFCLSHHMYSSVLLFVSFCFSHDSYSSVSHIFVSLCFSHIAEGDSAMALAVAGLEVVGRQVSRLLFVDSTDRRE